mmetsp:Transcript_17821/g.35987  ORF Transcript_17821/g.35987 Transcript_17821/m.35987 type:complete len:211 (-) Transcript_17821:100-732(-)
MPEEHDLVLVVEGGDTLVVGVLNGAAHAFRGVVHVAEPRGCGRGRRCRRRRRRPEASSVVGAWRRRGSARLIEEIRDVAGAMERLVLADALPQRLLELHFFQLPLSSLLHLQTHGLLQGFQQVLLVVRPIAGEPPALLLRQRQRPLQGLVLVSVDGRSPPRLVLRLESARLDGLLQSLPLLGLLRRLSPPPLFVLALRLLQSLTQHALLA